MDLHKVCTYMQITTTDEIYSCDLFDSYHSVQATMKVPNFPQAMKVLLRTVTYGANDSHWELDFKLYRCVIDDVCRYLNDVSFENDE